MSVLLVDKQTAFLHIPKTGGTWVEKALGVLELGSRYLRFARPGQPKKHATPDWFRKWPKQHVTQMFCFVRHPVAFYGSVWAYYKRKTAKQRKRIFAWFDWHPLQPPLEHWSFDFVEWVHNLLHHHPGWYGDLVQYYAPYCQWVGRTERLSQDLCVILKKLEFDFDPTLLANIPAKNAKPTNLQIPWDSSLKQQVEESEQTVIDRFYGSQYGQLEFEPTRSLRD